MYSIKTDLGVLGNSTLEKALLVKGDAVFKKNVTIEGTVTFANATFTSITVTGAANFASITATGSTSLADLSVSGNTVLGDAASDTVQVKGTASFAEPTTFASNITQTAGTAAFDNVTANTLTVAGLSKLDGNLQMLPASTATLGKVTAEELTVKGATTIKGLSTFEQKASFTDVEISGTLSGAFTMANGNFTNLTVSNDSNLNKLNVTGNAIFSSNISGLTSTATLQNITMNGQTALLTFNYNDTANPSYIRTSVQPYKVSTQEIQTNVAAIAKATVGKVADASGTEGLHSLGKATMDYVAIKGNGTIGTSQPQLTVAGTSVFSGKTTVGDLEITGAVSGLTFDDITATSLTVTGASSLQNVTMSGNLTALTGTATIQGITMNGASALLTFNYNDSTNPSYIKSSIQPYKVSSHEFQGDIASIRELSTGVVNDSIVGHKGLGVNELDYLHVKGNTTIGAARKQLQVDGDSQFGQTMTVNNIVVTGTTTGITADVAGADITPNSVTAATFVKGASLESTAKTVVGTDLDVLTGTATIKNLVVTGSTTGVTVTANVDGQDIAPNSVVTTTTATVGTDLSVGKDINALVGTTTVKNLVVTGTTTGVTVAANVDGLDIAPATVTTTGIATVGGDLTASADVIVTGTVSGAAGALKTGAITTTGNVGITGTLNVSSNINAAGAQLTQAGTGLAVTNNATIGGLLTAKDVTVTGTLTPAAIDLTNTDVIAKSLSTTGTIHTDTALTVGTNATITGDLAVTGNVTGTLKTAAITNTGVVDTGSLVAGSVQSPTIEAAAAGAGTLNLASNVTAAKDLTVTGTFTPAGGLNLAGAAISSASLSTTGNVDVGGNLTVAGTFDLSATNISALSLTSVGNTTVGAALILTNGAITGSPKVSGTLGVTGATTLSTLSTSGKATLALADVSGVLAVTGLAAMNGGIDTTDIGATTLTTSGKAKVASLEITGDTVATGNVTVNGTLTPAGGLNLGSADLSVNSVTTVANVDVGGALTVTGATNLNAGVTTTDLKVNGAATATTLGVTGLSTLTGGVKTSTVEATGRATTGEVQIGAGVWQDTYKLNVNGNSIFNGDVFISGKLNGTIDLSGVDLNPRNITASGLGDFAGTLTAGDTLTAPVGIFGAVGSQNNSLQVNGNVKATGDFEVGGVIKGTLDQSASAVKVGSLETMLAGGIKIGGNGPLVLGSGGIITGAPVISGNTSVGGTFTSTGLASLNGGLSVTGAVTLGATTLASLSVTGISTLTGNTTVGGTLGVTSNATIGGTLGVTGKTTVADLEITGTLTADIADLVTDSVTTKRYAVTPTTVAGTVTSTWTPDGTSSVYNISTTGAVQIGPMPNPGGKAGSWFIYVTNTDGGTIDMDSSYGLVGGVWGTAPGSVTICQVVYCGVGSTYDVFLAQRP